MNIDMTRTHRPNSICPECTRCLHYKDEGIYCIGDKKPCWNWEYDREKDPCDPAYLSPRFRRYLAPIPADLFEPIVPYEDLLNMTQALKDRNALLKELARRKEMSINEQIQSNN